MAACTALLAKPMNGINAPQRPDCVAGVEGFELANPEMQGRSFGASYGHPARRQMDMRGALLEAASFAVLKNLRGKLRCSERI